MFLLNGFTLSFFCPYCKKEAGQIAFGEIGCELFKLSEERPIKRECSYCRKTFFIGLEKACNKCNSGGITIYKAVKTKPVMNSPLEKSNSQRKKGRKK